MDTVWYFCLFLFFCAPPVELEPRFKMSVVSWQKSFHLIYRCLLAFEGSIDNLKINNFTENQSEVAHLVLHDSLVCVIAMQAKHF